MLGIRSKGTVGLIQLREGGLALTDNVGLSKAAGHVVKKAALRSS